MGEPSRYQIKDPLGRGGMGVVFRAYDSLMRREVALKTILDVHDPSARELFYREWGLQASITHPNIAEIYDIGEMRVDGQLRPYFVMPLLRGAPLAELLLASRHALTPERVIHILVQACRGLQAAHDRQLIHRDLKPSNIFVLEDDSVKLIDFGIAHPGGGAHTSVRGTLSYMAPELLDGKPASKASDLFAMGVLSYEALTGRRPFTGADDHALATAIRSSTPALPAELDARVSTEVSRVIFRALAKQPWQRYTEARDYADHLGRASRGEVIDHFDQAKVRPRFEKALRAFERGDYSLATDIVSELEGEGNVDAETTTLRRRIEQAQRGLQIRQYLESARRLFDEQEHSMALRKVQEALELDEQNADALALKNEIEKKRRASTAEEWLALARRHLDNNSFSQARAVVANLLELKPDNAAALALRAELERRESEAGRLRDVKDKLQREARGAWERGEVTSALANLEKWMDLDRSTPETDASRVASVRNLFVTVRTEHEAIRNSYEQARSLLEAGKFDEASDLCKLYLSKYPNHALFQAVQFDVEERRRQSLSAYIAEIDQQTSAEPDLDRRVALLEDAARRYPEESHFQRALEPARAKRDLVNSIVARARLFEEQGKLTEALEQWELLGPVHRNHPGLEYEKERVRRRKEVQSRSDAKAAWISKIEGLLEQGEHERAAGDARTAVAEFPSDPEVAEMARIAENRSAAGRQAAALVRDAESQLEAGVPAEAVALLRQALACDEHNPVVRPLLAQTLAEMARAAVESGTQDEEAVRLIGQVREIEPNHALAASLHAILSDRRRERAVSEAMAEARRLFNEQNMAGALGVCEQALQSFPNEPRLSRLAANLRNALQPATSQPQSVQPQAAQQSPSQAQSTPQQMTPPQMTPPQATPPHAVPQPAAASATAVQPSAPPTAPTGPQLANVAPLTPPGPVLAEAPPIPAPAAGRPVAPPPLPEQPAPAAAARRKEMRTIAISAAAGLLVLIAGGYFVTKRNAATNAPPAAPAPASSESPVQVPAAPPAAARALAVVNEWEGARILLDGAETSGESIALSNGEHRLEFQGPAPEVSAAVLFQVAPDGSVSLKEPPRAAGVSFLLVDRRQDGLTAHAPPGVEVLVDQAPGGIAAAGLDAHAIEIRRASQEPRTLTLPAINSPALQAFAMRPGRPDFGTIVISSNVDDLSVQIDSYVVPFKVRNGTALPRVPAGNHRVTIKREGFEPAPAQTVTVKRGEDSTLKFQLKPLAAPFTAAGLPDGSVLVVDGQPHEAAADGSVHLSLPPGEHTFELRRGSSRSKPLQRTALPGAALTLGAADLPLIPATGTLTVEVTPASAALSVKREGETAARPITSPATLAEGAYVVQASAPGFAPAESRVVVSAGRNNPLTLKLNPAPARRETPAASGASSEAAAGPLPGWREAGGWMLRRGGGFAPVGTLKPGAAISFHAALPDGRRLQWMVANDTKNFLLFKLERRKFQQIVSVNGKQKVIAESAVEVDLKSGAAIRIALSGNKILHSIGNLNMEMELPSGYAAGGPLGFVIPGGDEFSIKDLKR